MSKVKYSDWQKIIKAHSGKPEVVEFVVGGGDVVTVEVSPHISLTDRIALVNTVVDSCRPLPLGYEYDENTPDSTVDAHRKPAMEYLEPVFRASVLRYYTNLDFSAKQADLDSIWALAGNEDFYEKITDKIEDDLWQMRDDAYIKLKTVAGNREELAGRVLNLLDRIEAALPKNIMSEINSIIEKASDIDLDVSDILEAAGDEMNG